MIYTDHSGLQQVYSTPDMFGGPDAPIEPANVKDEWETPQALWNRLNSIFRFDADMCASAANHKTPLWFSNFMPGSLNPEDTVWCNPPYSMPGFFLRECFKHGAGGGVAVALVNFDSTKAFQQWGWKATILCFLPTRLKFEINGKPGPHTNTRPSVLCVYGAPPRFSLSKLREIGNVVWPHHE